MSFSDQVLTSLKARFQFKSVRGQWLQGGTCPSCGKKEAYCSADQPRMVKCGRIEKCGWEEKVRDILPELFEDWSKRSPQTDADPTATVDAYLVHERGLDLHGMRGAYSQELYRDRETGAVSATARFPLPNNSWWERLIDRPGRFPRKANFKYDSNWRGHWWMPPLLTWEILAGEEEIWLAEGIFDAWALNQVGITAVSLMSVNNWPEHALAQLINAINAQKRKTRPRLVFAFDVGAAGVSYTRKFVKRARNEGWPDATAAQVRPDGEGTKLDWNDLLLKHQGWNGDADRAPYSDALIDEYLWNGAVTIAESPREKAKLIHSHRLLSNFTYRFDNRMFAAKVTYDQDEGGDRTQRLEVEPIANCAFRILYMERDETLDETNYFLQVDFPEARPTVKARFSSNACAASGEFKKRLMAFAGTWRGSSDQLDSLMLQQTQRIRIVEPLPFTGYSDAHKAWVFGEIAVRDGRLIHINSEKFFEFGRDAVKLRTTERILSITYVADRQDYGWIKDLWIGWGERGLTALTFFIMSLFAVQIRKGQESLGFLELTGDAGSGKTTLITFLWKLLGRSGYEGFDPNKGTIAFLGRSMVKVSNLPVGLIEGNRDDRGGNRRQFDWTELLTLYNGRSPRGTGARTGGTETVEPPFLGAIYLMQNERIDSITAVLERLMSFSFDKEHWTAASPAAAERIEGLQVEDVSGTIVHIVRNEKRWLETYFKQYRFHRDNMKGRVDGLLNTRCIKNHSQLAAALEATAAILPIDDQAGDEAIGRTIRFIDGLALDRQLSAGGDHPLVAEFWDKFDYILATEARAGTKPEDSINRHRKPALIAINLNQFDQRVRNLNLAPLRMDEVKKLLRGSQRRKYVADKNVNGPDGIGSHCWIFENPDACRAPANFA
ncbi:toprim domain-containing protein [Sphingopyxis sp. J-6]|uniref:toprim domain-containing protein n=1 Tax=Sphingopyxis sp. J-6 TaxID=3122054 RepID=UPI0039841795